MLTYNIFLLVNLLVGIVLLYFSFIKEEYGKNVYLLFSFIQLALLGGLRNFAIGTDTEAYFDLFLTIKNTNNFLDLFTLNYELGYVFLNKIIALLGLNYQALLIVISLVISYGFIYFIKTNSKNYLLSVFLLITLYYYYASFNAIRQYLAIVIIINSFAFIKKKNIIYYLFMIILAFLFHYSAILFLPLYLLGLIKWNIKKIIVLLAILLILFLNLERIVYIIIDIIPQYKTYIGSNYLQGYTGSMYIVVNLTIFFFILVIYIAKKGYQNPTANLYIIFEILISSLTLYATKIYFANRISWYLTPFHIIIVPYYLSLINENKIRQIAIILIIAMGICYHTYCLSVNLHKITPYIYYWER